MKPLFPYRKVRQPEETDERTLLRVLIEVARETGVKWSHVEKGLGPERANANKANILGFLQQADIRVETPLDSLADSPLAASGLSRRVLQQLESKGIKTWRGLFTVTEDKLLADPAFDPGEVAAIREAIKRTGYRFGMTSQEVDARAAALSEAFAIPLLQLGLSTRAANALYNCDAVTLGGICALTEDYLRSMRNFGERSVEEVRAMAEKHGLSLGMIVPGLSSTIPA